MRVSDLAKIFTICHTSIDSILRRFHAQKKNLAAFTASPEKYAPQFGGFCSFAISKGFTASIDPEAYVVRDGQLYLFNSDSIRQTWLSEVDGGVIEAAQTKWATR